MPLSTRETDPEEHDERHAAGYGISTPGRSTTQGRIGRSSTLPPQGQLQTQARLAELEAHALRENASYYLVDRAGSTVRAQRAYVEESRQHHQCGRQQHQCGGGSRRAAVRREPTFKTKEELMEFGGFTDGQASGILLNRQQSPTLAARAAFAVDAASAADAGGAGCSASGGPAAPNTEDDEWSVEDDTEAAAAAREARKAAASVELTDLRSLGVPLQELLKLGFTAAVLAASGYSPAELKQNGVLLTKAAGFTPTQ